MKPNKNTIKVIKEFSILIDKLIELKKVSNPVPEYKKSSTFSEMCDKVKKEDPCLKNAYEEINKTVNEKCTCKRLVNFNTCGAILLEKCNRCNQNEKFKIPEGWVKMDLPPSEQYKKDRFYNLRDVFSTYTQEEIKKDPILKARGRLVLLEAIKQLDEL